MNKKTLIALAVTLPIVGAIVFVVVYAEAHMSENVSMALYVILMPLGIIVAIVSLVRWILLWRKSTPEERKAYTEYRRWWKRDTSMRHGSLEDSPLMEEAVAKTSSKDFFGSFNTYASYCLRGTIIVQLVLIVLQWLYRATFEQHFPILQRIARLTLFLIPVFLLVDVFTPTSPQRPRSKRIDIICFLTWLIGFSLLIIWGLLHCTDC